MVENIEPRVYAVVGATSDPGRVVVEQLTRAGHTVRPVSRTLGASIDDAVALEHAFRGAHGAYVMLPFDMHAEDLHVRELALGDRLAEALAAAAVPRIVVLSGLSAELKKGTALGAALLEERLDALGFPELVRLRAGFFMENFLKGLAFVEQAESGVFGTPFRADFPMPMIAAHDVGAAAAFFLMRPIVEARAIVELRGPRDYTMVEATGILADELGKTDVRYAQVALAEAHAGMLAAGLSVSFADAVLETARSFNAADPWGDPARAFGRETQMTLEAWAAIHLPAYAGRP